MNEYNILIRPIKYTILMLFTENIILDTNSEVLNSIPLKNLFWGNLLHFAGYNQANCKLGN